MYNARKFCYNINTLFASTTNKVIKQIARNKEFN